MFESRIQRRSRPAVVLVALLTVLLAAAGPASAAGPRSVRISAAIDRIQTLIGHPVTVTGKVSPHVAGERVRLQRASGARWVTLASAPVAKSGAFRFRTPASLRPAQYDLRVAVPATSISVATSTRLALAVVRWRHLSDLHATRAGACTGGTVDISGNSYAHSLYWSYDGSARCRFGYGQGDGITEYDLGRTCYQFSGDVGISDSSPTGGRVELVISSDVRGRFDRVLVPLLNNPVILPIAKASRLRLSVTLIAPGHGSDLRPAVGDARVLCAS